jgi:hypothetical protein
MSCGCDVDLAGASNGCQCLINGVLVMQKPDDEKPTSQDLALYLLRFSGQMARILSIAAFVAAGAQAGA